MDINGRRRSEGAVGLFSDSPFCGGAPGNRQRRAVLHTGLFFKAAAVPPGTAVCINDNNSPFCRAALHACPVR